MNDDLINAIENMNVIQFNYDGEPRVVEAHCYGVTTKGNEAIRAYQVGGYSSSGSLGWKLYDLSKMADLEILDDSFSIRSGYNKGDKGMHSIFIEL